VRKWLVAVIAVLLVVVGGYWVRQQLLIDDCLDGGGRWDDSVDACER